MARALELLVGRPAELDAFEGLLEALDDGAAAAVAIIGEPGIGKTRLLAELADRAEARGQLVLSGSASELERDLPFWVFVDALDEYAEGLDPRRLDQLDETARTELAHVFPSLSGLGSGGGVAVQDERYRTHRAVRDLLETLASSKPLVLILDDLHWADSGTIELLGALLRRLPAAPVLIAMAMRPRQTPGRLAAAFERAHRAGRLTRHELGALSLPEARQLLGADFDEHRGHDALRGQRWQSVLPRATRALPGSWIGPRRGAPRSRPRGRQGPSRRRRRLDGGARAAVDRRPPRTRGRFRRG